MILTNLLWPWFLVMLRVIWNKKRGSLKTMEDSLSVGSSYGLPLPFKSAESAILSQHSFFTRIQDFWEALKSARIFRWSIEEDHLALTNKDGFTWNIFLTFSKINLIFADYVVHSVTCKSTSYQNYGNSILFSLGNGVLKVYAKKQTDPAWWWSNFWLWMWLVSVIA